MTTISPDYYYDYGGTPTPPSFDHISNDITSSGIKFSVNTDNIISHGDDFADNVTATNKTVSIGESFTVSAANRKIKCKYGWNSVDVTLNFSNFNDGFSITPSACSYMTINVGKIENNSTDNPNSIVNGTVTLTLTCSSYLENAINLYKYITIKNGSSIVSSPTSPAKTLNITSEDNNGSETSLVLGYTTSVSSSNEEYITISGTTTKIAKCIKTGNPSITTTYTSSDGKKVLSYTSYNVTINNVIISGIETGTINRPKGELLSIKLSATKASVSTYIGNSKDVSAPSNLKVLATYGATSNVTKTLSYSNFTNGIKVKTSDYTVVSLKYDNANASSSTPVPVGNVLELSNSNSSGSFILTAEKAGLAIITVTHGSYTKTYTITVTSDSTTDINISSDCTLSYSANSYIDVDKSGTSAPTKVTGKTEGSGTLTVTATYNNKTTSIDYCTVTVSKQSVTIPTLTRQATLDSISCSKGTTSAEIYLGNNTTITKPTVTASWTWSDTSYTVVTIIASQFDNITATSSDTSTVEVSTTGESTTPGTKTIYLKGKAAGSATITVYNNDYKVGTYTATVTNISKPTDVTSSVTWGVTSNIISLSGTTVTATGNSAGTTGTAYVKATYNGKVVNFCTVTVSKQLVTVPSSLTRPATLDSISCSGGTASKEIYLGNSATITKPTNITANYSYGVGSGTISYTTSQFGTFNASVPNTNIIEISGTGIIGYTAGQATITITNNGYKVGDYTCKVSNQSVTTDVTSSASYSVTSNIISLSGTTVTATGNSAGTTGTAYIRVSYGGKTSDFCTVVVKKQTITCPNSLIRLRGSLTGILVSGGTVSGNLTAFTGGTCKFTTPTTKATVTANYGPNTNVTGTVSQSVTGNLTLSSSDASVISVSGTTLTGLKAGEVTITVYNNEYKVGDYTCKVTNQSLTADVTESTVDSYSTSDSSYFTMADSKENTIRPNVPTRYTITTKKPGTAYVKATYTYSNQTASFECQKIVITDPTVTSNNDALNNTGGTTITRTIGSVTGVSIGSSIAVSNVTVYCGGSASYTPPTVKLNVSYGTGGNKTDCIKIEYGNFTDGISFDISGDSIKLGTSKADGTENPGGGYQNLSTVSTGKSTVSVKHNGTVIRTYYITVNDTTGTSDHTPESTSITAESTDNSLTILNGNKVQATTLTGGTIKGTYTYAGKSISATLFNVVVKNPTIGDIPTSFKRTKDTVNKIESISGGTISKISVFNGNTTTVNQPTAGTLTVDYDLKNDSKTFSYSNFTDGITVTSSNTNYITTSCSNGICTLNCVGAPEGSDHTATPTEGTVTISVMHKNTIIKTVNVSVLNEPSHVVGVKLNGSVSYSQSGNFFTLDTSNNKLKITGSNSELTTKTGSITATYNHLGTIYSNYKVCNVEIKQPNITIPSGITRLQKPNSITCDKNFGKINIYKGSTDYFDLSTNPKIKATTGNTSTNISYNSSEFGGGFSMSSDNSIISVSGSTLTTTGTSTGSANITINNGNQKVATGKVNVYNPSLDYTVAPGDCSYYINGGDAGYITAGWNKDNGKIALTANNAGTNGKLYIKYTANGSTTTGVSISDIITVLDAANVSYWGCDSNNKIYRPKNDILKSIYSVDSKPSAKVGVFVGNNKEVIGLPSSIVLEYGNSNKSYNMTFTNFIDIPTVTSSNTEVIDNPDSEKITLTGAPMATKSTGTTTITVKHQDTTYTKTITVENADNKTTVTSGWTYELIDNIAEIK